MQERPETAEAKDAADVVEMPEKEAGDAIEIEDATETRRGV